ncbi:hypothetical protein TELCIR_22043 [Teladorsagia circumcincta]|uniref:Uncharacterized protein n=1 Tax=Teladorsagia circumcincta TaxID=45464 RepID=A0A2G9TF23_TELCI|nr:hypothetical protein TELCIR_22043 [Teladorsagia circumcincta]
MIAGSATYGQRRPSEGSFHAENNDEGTEFNNPLYSRQSVVVDPERGELTAEEEALEEKKIRGRSRTDRTQSNAFYLSCSWSDQVILF